MNLLTGAMSSVFNNYLVPEGPLKDAWRIGTSAFGLTSEEQIKEIENTIYDLKEKDTLEMFMTDHDRAAELGIAALCVCISNWNQFICFGMI